MPVKSQSKNVQISADTLAAIMQRLETQGQQLTALIEKPAAKPTTQAAVKAAPELTVEVFSGKRGDGILIKYGSAKWGTMLYLDQFVLIKKHFAAIDAAFKKLG